MVLHCLGGYNFESDILMTTYEPRQLSQKLGFGSTQMSVSFCVRPVYPMTGGLTRIDDNRLDLIVDPLSQQLAGKVESYN
ncbi:hypothetical protein LTS17_010865 [Exophiala oligosperma]